MCIAVQETLSPLANDLIADDGEGDEETSIADAPTQIIRALGLYASSIRRLVLRKKSSHDTLLPLFTQLKDVVRCSQSEFERPASIVILGRTCHVISESVSWARDGIKAGEQDVEHVKSLCLALLDAVLGATYDTLGTAHAQKTLDELFPQFIVPRGRPSAATQSDGGANDVLQDVVTSYMLLGRNPATLVSSASTSTGVSSPSPIPTLVLLAHSKDPNLTSKALEASLATSESHLLPMILDALQTTSGLDAALAIISRACIIPQNQTSSTPASSPTTPTPPLPTSLLPLIPALALVSAAHPFPPIRAVAFRILGAMTTRCDESVRVKVLLGLCGADSIDNTDDDSDWGLDRETEEGHELDVEADIPRMPQAPQMHVAAVGLVKDEVLRALSASAWTTSRFAPTTFLRTFGPVLFIPRPKELFDALYIDGKEVDREALSAFLGGPEAARLVQVFSFLYVLLLRDKENKTGIRSPKVLGTVRRVILDPLRRLLGETTPEVEARGHHHRGDEGDEGYGLDTGVEGMMEAALGMGVERVDGALMELRL